MAEPPRLMAARELVAAAAAAWRQRPAAAVHRAMRISKPAPQRCGAAAEHGCARARGLRCFLHKGKEHGGPARCLRCTLAPPCTRTRAAPGTMQGSVTKTERVAGRCAARGFASEAKDGTKDDAAKASEARVEEHAEAQAQGPAPVSRALAHPLLASCPDHACVRRRPVRRSLSSARP